MNVASLDSPRLGANAFALLGTFNLRNGVDLTAKAALAQEKGREKDAKGRGRGRGRGQQQQHQRNTKENWKYNRMEKHILLRAIVAVISTGAEQQQLPGNCIRVCVNVCGLCVRECTERKTKSHSYFTYFFGEQKKEFWKIIAIYYSQISGNFYAPPLPALALLKYINNNKNIFF